MNGYMNVKKSEIKYSHSLSREGIIQYTNA
jgi:hypothetical protein